MADARVPNLDCVVPAAAQDGVRLGGVVLHTEDSVAVARCDVFAVPHAALEATAQRFRCLVVNAHRRVLAAGRKLHAVRPVVEGEHLTRSSVRGARLELAVGATRKEEAHRPGCRCLLGRSAGVCRKSRASAELHPPRRSSPTRSSSWRRLGWGESAGRWRAGRRRTLVAARKPRGPSSSQTPTTHRRLRPQQRRRRRETTWAIET